MKNVSNLATKKIELLCAGVRAEGFSDKGRKTGAGPAGGRYFLLDGKVCVDIPLQGRFVENSPFTIVNVGGKWVVQRNGEQYAYVEPIPHPHFYEKHTIDGIPMKRIAILHGKDCLASTIYSRCIYWREGVQCKFCGIELEKPNRLTFKTPQQLGEVAVEAFKEGVAKHVTLTIGTLPTPDKGAILLARATKEIKEKTNLPVHVQLEPPKDKRFLDLLQASGVDTIGIHVECFDEKVLSKVCLMKRDLEVYFDAWKYCVELFGEEQVSSFIIAGLGETDESVLEGAADLAALGVVPFLVPLRPIIGTPLENAYPPNPERMLKVYQGINEILRIYGVNPLKSKAGCVRCGACSALNETFLQA